MAAKERKRDTEQDPLKESAPEEERFADQQFGATAARDQERAQQVEDPDQKLLDTDQPRPRAGNKAEPA